MLKIPFPHPRDRREMLETPDYYALREYLITFLEERAHLRPSQMQAGAAEGKIVNFPAAGGSQESPSSAKTGGA